MANESQQESHARSLSYYSVDQSEYDEEEYGKPIGLKSLPFHKQDDEPKRERQPFLSGSGIPSSLMRSNFMQKQQRGFCGSYKCLIGFALLIVSLGFITYIEKSPEAKDKLFNSKPTFTQEEQINTKPQPTSAFSGEFANFPSLSSIPKEDRKITLLVQWTHDNAPNYLHAFFNSVQHNADSVELVFLNRVVEPGRQCLDFDKAGIDISWGGNIKHVCISMEDWKRRMLNFLCDKEHGWNCSEQQLKEVGKELDKRPDVKGWEWKPFRGQMYRDLFITPSNPFWAWMDADSILGDFRHFPFNILSNTSFITFDTDSASQARLLGQLTAWNMNDVRLRSVWKLFPTLQTADHFTKALAGPHIQSDEEQEWGYRYMNVDDGFPGRELSFVHLPDGQGDDFFDDGLDLGIDQDEKHKPFYAISGRDILLVNRQVEREYIEELIGAERDSILDEVGWSDWSMGYDGSDRMIKDPTLTMQNAIRLRNEEYPETQNDGHFKGKLETIQWKKGKEGCPDAWWIKNDWRICHPKRMHIPMLRTSFVHFRNHPAGYLFERREVDRRPRGYSRYLIKHTLRSKRYSWAPLPEFNISQNHIFTFQKNQISVWKMGDERNNVIYNRQSDGKNTVG